MKCTCIDKFKIIALLRSDRLVLWTRKGLGQRSLRLNFTKGLHPFLKRDTHEFLMEP